MIHHCQAVRRGAPHRPLIVADMPFGSYEFDDCDIALKNAYRLVKEGGMDAVKLEVCLSDNNVLVSLDNIT
jgi:3-methyl-2-oxobutanoate hydroxymethyltransferase